MKGKKPDPGVCVYCGGRCRKWVLTMIVPHGETPKVFQAERDDHYWAKQNGRKILQITRRRYKSGGKSVVPIFDKSLPPGKDVVGGKDVETPVFEEVSCWLGDYFHSSEFFCKNKCAEAFGAAAVRAGYRMRRKIE